MSISDIVSVSITANTRTPTRAGFGTPLCLAYSAALTAGQTYTAEELSDLTDLGVSANSGLYKMVQAIMSQDVRPEEVKVATLAAGHSQSVELTMTTAVEGDVVTATLTEPDGTEHDISYTVGAAETTTTVATAVAALIDAFAGVTATSTLAVVSVDTDTAGDSWGYTGLSGMDFEDVTADAGYDTALSALELADADWYGFAVENTSEANVDAVAAWVETRSKLFAYQTQNTGEKDGTGTMAADLKALGYDRTLGLYSEDVTQHAGAAWLGKLLPTDPGSATWAFKELTGVTPSDLSATEEGNMEADNLNHYTTVGGLNMTRYGVAASGEFIDITRGIDWLTARLQERILGILANAKKVPYTDASVDMIVGEVLSQLEIAEDRGLISPGTSTASGPKVASVSTANRAARTLPDIKFGGTLAGAIHKVVIAGTLSV